MNAMKNCKNCIHKVEGCAQTKSLVSWLLTITCMLYKSEHMAIIICTCTSHFELSKSICSPDISNFIGKPSLFSGHFSIIYEDFILIHTQIFQIKQIADHTVIEQCLSNCLIPISAL